jgi:putative tryptophan/tyrosine transport system substrate-binding protein
MWTVVKRLSLGVSLIVMTSAVLLLSDRDNRVSSARRPRVALISFASTLLFEEGTRGILDGLAAGGYAPGDRMELSRYNAEADIATVNTIAREVVGSGFDVVITQGTPTLQAVANANRGGQLRHVYGLVADATRSGVGVSATDPYDHPPHLVGVSSFIPSIEVFTPARQMLPSLKRIGLVWNSGETNSAIFAAEGRTTAAAMDLEILEASVESSAGVGEAASSLVARGAQALWVSGDSTVQQGVGALIRAASQGRIPVFTIQPGDVEMGALFDMGLNFYDIGRETAQRVIQVLDGTPIAKIPSANATGRVLMINIRALGNLRDPWRVPPDLLAKARVVIDEKGRHERGKATDAAETAAKSR